MQCTAHNNFLHKKIPYLHALQENREMGARYLDPKYSRWISEDPALGEYVPQAPVNDEAKKHNQNLPGMGGLFNTVNLNLYHYAGNNPIKYTDPDGREEYDLINDTKEGVALIFKLVTKLPKSDITVENCPFSEANALSNFMNEKPEFWAILGGVGLLVGGGYLCPPIKDTFNKAYDWLMQFYEDYILSNGFDIVNMSYSLNDNDITKFTAKINNISFGEGALNTNILFERVLYKINDERGNIIKFNFNVDLLKDKSNVTFGISFAINGQYRRKDFEKTLSNFSF